MKEREYFLDKLRTAAACAVVLLHTITGVMDTVDLSPYPLEEKVFLAALDLVCWCVPVFLIISGYLFLNPEREMSFRKILTKYCKRIVLALFLFGAPYACLEQIAVEKAFRWEMLGKSFLMVLRGESWSHMWYLYLILFLYLLTPAIRWLLAHAPLKAVYGLQAALFILCSLLPYLFKLFGLERRTFLPEDGIYFFYYICGYLFAVHSSRIKEPHAVPASVRAAPVLAVLLAAGMLVSRLPGKYTLQMAYNYPFTVALALLLFVAAAAAEPRHRNDYLWQRISALSFTIYLIHPVYLNTAYKFLHITPLMYPIGASLPVFYAVTLLLSAITAWVLSKIPPLKKYVL